MTDYEVPTALIEVDCDDSASDVVRVLEKILDSEEIASDR